MHLMGSHTLEWLQSAVVDMLQWDYDAAVLSQANRHKLTHRDKHTHTYKLHELAYAHEVLAQIDNYNS